MRLNARSISAIVESERVQSHIPETGALRLTSWRLAQSVSQSRRLNAFSLHDPVRLNSFRLTGSWRLNAFSLHDPVRVNAFSLTGSWRLNARSVSAIVESERVQSHIPETGALSLTSRRLARSVLHNRGDWPVQSHIPGTGAFSLTIVETELARLTGSWRLNAFSLTGSRRLNASSVSAIVETERVQSHIVETGALSLTSGDWRVHSPHRGD